MMTVAFVCQHGAAKSVIAAEYYQALAAERGLVARARAHGIEPDEEVPEPVVEGLRDEGFDVAGHRPCALTTDSLADADLVVVMGCELPDTVAATRVVRWEDVPAVSDGYEAARTHIVQRLQALLDGDAQDAHPRHRSSSG